jgi:hypothetical protein
MRTVYAALAFCACLTAGDPAAHAGPCNEWAHMRLIVPQGYVCHHTTSPLVIDGRLDEPDWQSAPWTHDFADIEGDVKSKPRFRTHAKMLWDDRYFYVAAELEEPHVWATLTQHDSVIFQDNDFEIFMDPNGDSHEYYEIEMNALNTEWDLFLPKPYKDQGSAHNEWEIPGLKTAVYVGGTLNDPSDTDRGWSVEIAFPWKVLARYAHRRCPPREGDQWRVNFSRVEWQINIVDGKYLKVPNTPADNWVWSPQGIIDMHRPEKWGYVQFTRKPFGTVAFVPDPSMPARNALQEIYYAQRTYFAANHRYAAFLEELGLAAMPAQGLARLPGLKLTKHGFKATAEIPLASGRLERWHIREDALVWRK